MSSFRLKFVVSYKVRVILITIPKLFSYQQKKLFNSEMFVLTTFTIPDDLLFEIKIIGSLKNHRFVMTI